MSILYLTPASIGYLTQFILASAIAGYFWYLARRSRQGENSALPTTLLAGAFTSFACGILLVCLDVSHPDWRFYVMPLESMALVLFLALFLQFAYRFPSPPPGQNREARVVLWLTILYALWEGGIAIQRYAMLAQGIVKFRPAVADYPLAVGFLWLAIVFLRQTVRTSTSDPHATVASLQPPSSGVSPRGRGSERIAGDPHATVWRKLWRPRGRAARTARAFALLSTLPVWFNVVNLLRGYLILPPGVTELIHSLGILFTLSAFALVYLNYLPETTSFMVKLVGVTLAAMLAILGSVGWIVTPSYVAAYDNDGFITDKQTLRFTPNPQGGYDVAVVPFHFDDDFGVDLGYGDVRRELPFDFPFYDQVWREAYLLSDGAVSFSQALDWTDARYRYGPLPAIFPLSLDLVIDPTDPSGDDGFFARHTADRLIVTWNQLPEDLAPENRYTFQLTLHPDGVFEFTYNGLPAAQNYDIYEPRNTAWVIGAIPGSGKLRPHHLRFTADLPYVGGGRGGIVEDYYLDFRRYLHQLFLPLAYLVIGSSALIVISFPIFFRLNLVRPLDSLLEGVRQVNAGNLGVTMPVQYHDEIGFLTQWFNDTTAKLQRRTLALRRRAAELEALTSVSSALREATTREDVISVLLEETIKVCEADAGAVLLLEDDALVVAGLQGVSRTLLGRRLLPCGGPCWQTMDTGQLILSAPIEWQRRAVCELAQTLAHGMMTRAVVPLRAGEETLGLLQIAFSQPDKFFEEHRRPLIAIAEMGGNALQRARAIATLEQLARDRMRDLTALYEVTTTTTQYLDTQIVLERVLEKALEVTGGDAGIIHLRDDEERDTLRLAVQRGSILPGLMNRVDAQLLSDSLWGQVMEQNEPLVVLDVFSDVSMQTLRVSPEGSLAYVGVPIHTKRRILGVLSVFVETIQRLAAEDIALLAAIADLIGAAMESAQLRQRAEEAAVMEERQRLARELHDSVTQLLYGLTLFAEAGRDSARAADPTQVQHYLGRLGETAQQALKEMRLLIFELHPPALTQAGLVGALRQRLEAVERRAGVETQLLVEKPLELPANVEASLYRIAEEALNNLLKHSAATRVTVRLGADEEGLVLEVTDNGQGFDLEAVRDHGGMGLVSMQERAEALGGSLRIVSAPGGGTSVKVIVPLLEVS